MGTAHYKKALAAAIEDYDRLKAEREAIEMRLAQLRQTIGALGPLCELPRHDPLGLTDACRSVLRAKYGGLTPVEVKAGLQTMGLDLAAYSNPLASIHSVLKRLARSGEVIHLRDRRKKTVYAWKHPVLPVAVTDGQGGIVSAAPGAADWVSRPMPTGRKNRKKT